MALTWYTYPNTTYRQSVSYPLVVIATASAYNTANVTQHRVKAVLKYGTTVLVTKYTVVYDEALKLAKFDISEIARNQLPIGIKDATSSADITKITSLRSLLELSQKDIIVELTEQYYLSGVFTSSATLTQTFHCVRGWTIPAGGNKEQLYGNWYERNALQNFMPFSGKIKQVYPTRAEDRTWPTTGTHAFLIVNLYKNGGALTASYNNLRADKGIFYFPLYLAGTTDQDDFVYWNVRIGTGTTPPTILYSAQNFNIYKNVDDCEGEGETIMFQDSLYTWAFMHFPKKSRTTVTTTGTQGELIPTATNPGRFKYNVEASDVLELSTDWMDEEQNPLIQDLIATESAWLVDPSDGSLEQVVVVQNTVRLKKRSTDNMIMYTMSFRKSLNNFKP